jgi:Tfp pilus assembly protein PilW
MVELTVALVAGLVVAMGVVGLSREATATFSDEGRSSAAEATLRVAIERLRGDLQRAGYMSTGNIVLDPFLALTPGSTAGAANQAAYLPTAAAPTCALGGMCGLQNLTSIYWLDNGSNGAGAVNNKVTSAAQTPTASPVALTPDLIQIAGNMTTSEEFDVQNIVYGSNAACAAGGTVITLSPASPAIVRTFGGTPPNAANAASYTTILGNIFTPDGASTFLVRLVDNTGKSQFLATCPPPTVGFDAAFNPYVLVDGANTPIFYGSASGTTSVVGGVTGRCLGCQINPVQIVEWELTNSSSGAGATHKEPTFDSANLGNLSSLVKTADANKYDLMRTYLDATGTFLSGTSEIVAEYAVDLSFAFTGESGTSAAPTATSNTTSCAFDDNASPSCNSRWGQQVHPIVPGTVPPFYGPQRIRTVRARITTRTALPDRSEAIPIVPGPYPSAAPFQTYLYRYNLPAGAYPAPLTWARARTVTTEVATPNLMRNFY